MPGLVREQRQALLDVVPLVRIAALFLGEDARVLQMVDADVVGRERQPHTIGPGDGVRHAVYHLADVARAAVDALVGAQPIAHAHLLRGLLRQHHDAAHAGRRCRLRIPIGFLIADGREQSPIVIEFLARLFERRLEARQAVLDPQLVDHQVYILGAGGGAVVTINQVSKLAGGAEFLQKLHRRVVQAVVVAPGKGPGQGLGLLDIECHLQLREVLAVEGDDAGVGDGDIEQTLPDQLQQLLGLLVGFVPFQPGMLFFKLGQALDVAGTGVHLDLSADEVADAGGARVVEAIDHLLADLLVRRGEADQRAPRRGDGDAGGRHVGLATGEAGDDVGEFVGRHRPETDPEMVGEGLGQVVFESRRAFRAVVIGRVADAREHDELARGFDRLEFILEQRAGGDRGKQERENHWRERRTPGGGSVRAVRAAHEASLAQLNGDGHGVLGAGCATG